ncbi:MAG: hypothetical protein GYA02_12855, partial [Clostridiaceae bacterium]|nr:hypothetical protein [Clostridiaceae bacterium]
MSELYFGYSDCIITPHANIGLAGYEKRNNHGFGNSGVMDDLYARALSLKSENDELILITLDLCLINENTGDEIRSRVAQKLKIPVENVMLCVSHTHSGPRTWSPNDDTGSETTQIINSYMDDVTNKIVSICSQASSISFKGQIYTATFSASLGYNRRYVVEDKDSNDNDDKVKMLFNLWKNPEHNTNGIIDTDIPVLLIERIDEKKLYDSYFGQAGLDRIVLFNVPIHPVVMGEDSRYVSADYPGAARRCIENTLGYGTKAMFLLGACGNVNPLLACQYNPKAIEVLGNAIGY